MLMLPEDAPWTAGWRKGMAVAQPRLVLHELALLAAVPAERTQTGVAEAPVFGGMERSAVQALDRLGPALGRFDFCVLPVRRASLCRARMMLAWRAHNGSKVPWLGLLEGLTAPAIRDLLRLGLDDFVLCEADADEVQARVARLPRLAGREDVRDEDETGRQQGGRAADASGAMPLLSLCGISYAHVPFQEAKRQVLGQFEQEYLNGALRAAGGNVAAAARAVCKHRRAFWSLMRKHGVDARRYRPEPLSVARRPGAAACQG